MGYKKLFIVGLGTIVTSLTVLTLIWRLSASYVSLIPVFLVGARMTGLVYLQLSLQRSMLSARSRGGLAKATTTAYYLAQQLGLIIGVSTFIGNNSADSMCQRPLADLAWGISTR